MGFWFGLSIFLFVFIIVALLGFYIYTNILSKDCVHSHGNVSGFKQSKTVVKEDVVKDYSSGDDE